MTNVSWYSIFIICKENMDSEYVTKLLKIEPSAFVKAGELPIPSIEEGATRRFDDRLRLDTWKKQLNSRQLKHSFEDQIQFWADILSPIKTEIQQLTKMGYWCVIDFQAYKIGDNPNAIQFRIEPKMQQKFAEIGVCFDINIF